MDKWLKTVSRFPPHLRKKVGEIIVLILANELDELDVKKLRGLENSFRVRFGKIRIIFASFGNENKIISVGFRDNKTYKKLS